MFCSTRMPHLADTLGSSLRYLVVSFEQIRGVTTVQALQDGSSPEPTVHLTHRSTVPGHTPGHPLLSAGGDRLFRLEHLVAEALVLTPLNRPAGTPDSCHWGATRQPSWICP